ncbi:Phosphatase [Labrenzia sp. THAF82]|uniref:HAD family hydrolase n=1 Tax=Labrenzia sp. THAF82 TaxID=2587861 RepID=UPI001267DE97|nr:HAD family phosphatase [Labrenzia sp. THAF82]QFT34264.1 Phosphatase [Labrenzia sp. THAF82]
MNDVITTVVFDIGNVLIEWNPEHLYRRLIPDEVERADFLQNVCNMNWNLEQDLGRSWADAVDTLSALHPDKADLIAAYSDQWHEMIPGEVSGTRQILQELQEKNTPLFAVTNFSNEKFAECLVRFPFLKTSFVDTVVSAEERLIKPDPRIYQVLFTRNGLEPGTCLFIDDSAANVEAARNVGMQAHHFKEADALRQDLKNRGLLTN